MISGTFVKGERLCSLKAIEELFDKGHSFYSSYFQVIWLITENSLPFPAQVAFSVSKKKFRRAVKRNLIKRRIREVYRKNKQILYDFLNSKNIRIVFIMIFKGDIVPDYPSTEKAVLLSLDKLIYSITKEG